MAIKIVRQYTVFLPNVPGALCRFIELFANEGVNIVGIASEIRDDSGVVRVTVDTDKKISYILTSAGFTTVDTPMISLELSDQPGELLRLAKALADHGINITTVYGTALGGKTGRILINVSNAEKAVEILKASLEIK
ncbi:MAG: ACT domain-containing protein [Elusimicrobia bacterium]|nr:ACT domain-containing protein [Elusimicrobiota bacterium]